MAGYAAALLDELMGRNRDANPNDKKRDLHWSDPQVIVYGIVASIAYNLNCNLLITVPLTRLGVAKCRRPAKSLSKYL